MGFFDLPAPLFGALDNLMGPLPEIARLSIWAVLTAALSMALYWLCSAQDKVAAAKQRAIDARRAMAAYTGTEFDEMLPLAKESLVASLKHTGIVLGPALLSSLPALAVIVFVSNNYSYRMPDPGGFMHGHTSPEIPLADLDTVAQNPEMIFLVNYPEEGQTSEIVAANGEKLLELPMKAAIPMIHKKQWWNLLIGNPNGYIPDDYEIDSLHFTMPSIMYLEFGPAWMRGWEFTYFTLLILVSLGIKFAFRIH